MPMGSSSRCHERCPAEPAPAGLGPADLAEPDPAGPVVMDPAEPGPADVAAEPDPGSG